MNFPHDNYKFSAYNKKFLYKKISTKTKNRIKFSIKLRAIRIDSIKNSKQKIRHRKNNVHVFIYTRVSFPLSLSEEVALPV